jgi:hypothetical protein
VYVCFPSEQSFGDRLAALGLGATPAEARSATKQSDELPAKPRAVRVEKAPAWVKVELVGRFVARAERCDRLSPVEKRAHEILGSDPWVYQKPRPVLQPVRQKRRRQRPAPEF